MNNDQAPNNRSEEAASQEYVDNPFDNENLKADERDVEPEHPTDHPGRDYEPAETTEVDEPGLEDNTERHPATGVSAPSTPRRPGSGTRQAVRHENTEPVTHVDPVIPGEVFLQDAPVQINVGAEVTKLRVANNADRPIQIGSHFHFAEVNPALEFDRKKAWGKRLNVLSGGAMRFEPGADEEIELIDFRGDRIALGFRGECGGKLDG